MPKTTLKLRSETHEVCLFHVLEESTYSPKGMRISRTYFVLELYKTVLNKLWNIISLKKSAFIQHVLPKVAMLSIEI